jgi:hypothetical protein
MSNYFRTLLRFEKERKSRDRGGDDDGAAPRPKRLATTARGEAAYGRLLDSLRAVESELPAPGVVIAAADAEGTARPVVEGLRRQAASHGVRLLYARLVVTGSERLLRTEERATESPVPPVDLAGSTGNEATLRDWFRRHTPGHDLVLVEAPPLTASVDAALLARACDGLALVVEPMSTRQEDFENAIEHARSSGCRVLGLVMNRSRSWLPRLLRGLFKPYPRSISPKAPPAKRRPSRRR